ncbi:hypothetical protein BGX26_005147 [Mortierella sp. AD094]|nr:hypothetical protein BGX26_005147 [Mortierella sp. AD094]
MRTAPTLYAVSLDMQSIRRQLNRDICLASYALTQTLNWMMRQYIEIESNIVSIERLHEYVELKPEAPEIIDDPRLPQDWPAQGRVDFVMQEDVRRPNQRQPEYHSELEDISQDS